MAIIPDECKFHVVSEGVDTVDRGSKLAQSKRESITMADIKQSIPTPVGIFERSTGECSIKPVTNPAYSAYDNVVTADQSSVLGGLYNKIYNTEPSGSQGSYYCVGDVIAGGYGNCVYSKGTRQTQNFIGGGNFNYILYNGETNTSGEYYTATNVIGGGGSNAIYGYVKSASILGGNNNNIQTRGAKSGGGANEGFIGGGLGNKICMRTNGDYYTTGTCGVISGGARNCITSLNCAQSSNSTISGGYQNCVQATGTAIIGEIGCTVGSVISGGKLNKIITECEIANYNAIGGGLENIIKAATNTQRVCNSTISGGYDNYICATYSTIAGGRSNLIETRANSSSIGGGACNYICSDAGLQSNDYSTISGGGLNLICGDSTSNSTIGGGYYNYICGPDTCNSTISGGYYNRIYGDASYSSTISGGYCNKIYGACSFASTIGGGYYNKIYGDDSYSSTISGGFCNYIYGAASHNSTIGGGFCNKIYGACSFASTIGGGCYNHIE